MTETPGENSSLLSSIHAGAVTADSIVAAEDILEGDLATVADDEWLAAHGILASTGAIPADELAYIWAPGTTLADLPETPEFVTPDVPLGVGSAATEEPAADGPLTADAGDVARMWRIIRRCEANGLTVRLIPGWESRGRTWARVPYGVVDHHDASSSKSGEWGALGIITTGRTGIPGPLSQFQIARGLDGVPKVAIVAAGRANHAGRGGPTWFGPDQCPKDSGNSYLYGVEKAANGIGEKATSAADLAADILFEAILSELAGRPFDSKRVRGHREWTPRKVDPAYSMEWRRERVAARHATPTEPDPKPKPVPAVEEDTMRVARTDRNKVTHQYLWTPGHMPTWIRSPFVLGKITAAFPTVALHFDKENPEGTNGSEWNQFIAECKASLSDNDERASDIADHVAARLGDPRHSLGAAVAEVKTLVQGVAEGASGAGVSAEDLRAMLDEAVSEALADKVVAVNVTVQGDAAPTA